jgi:thymidine kinase
LTVSKLYFRYAAMNAGKSTALLQVAHNYEERGMRVLLFTAAHDQRAGQGMIGSRLGLTRSAATFGPDTEFTRDHLAGMPVPGSPPGVVVPVACVLIDEAQFLTHGQVRQLHRMAHVDDLPVICWGLRSDFRGEAFEGSAALLTLADEVEEMKSICACARKATMNIRIDAQGRRVQQGAQVEIGGNERYRAVCPACFYSEDDAGDVAPGLFG